MHSKSLLMTAIVGALSSASYAQTQPSTAADSTAEQDGFEQITVTAQRRTESLMEIPVAATSLSGDALKNNAISQVRDLQTASPSLSITDAGPTTGINIRGIGIASDSPNVTTGVATYMDGIFQTRVVQGNSFYDIENVEVYRGPQGTFVGSNSTGGAIFINSKDPRLGEFSGSGQLGLSNYSGKSAEGAINVPIGEEAAVRLAATRTKRDSFYNDIGPYDNDAGKLDETGARLGLLWQPGNFTALLKLQTHDRDTGGYAARPIAGTTYGDYREGDSFTLSFDEETLYKDELDLGSLKLEYEFANGIVLRSLTGYQKKRVRYDSDSDASQAPIYVNGDIFETYEAIEDQRSQEINLISPTNGDFDWVVGYYYQDNDIDLDMADIQAGFPTDIIGMTHKKMSGLFAQANYQVAPEWEVQLGGRYSRYQVTGTGGIFIGDGTAYYPEGGLQVASLEGNYRDNQVTGKLSLNWQPQKDTLVYAQVSTGYKPGGFNSLTSEFDKENVTSYELGYKFTAFDNHVRTQLAAYVNDYTDFQNSVLDTSTGVEGVGNLQDMTIKGLEAQVEGYFGAFKFTGNLGYISSELQGQTFVNVRKLPGSGLGVQCADGVASNPPVCFDYSDYWETTDGGDALYAPKWTYSMNLSYEFIPADGYYLIPRLNYSHLDKQYSYLAYNDVSDVLQSRDLLNAAVVLTNDEWTVELYATNLTDKEYISGQYSTTEFYGAPRQFGLRLSASFF